MSSRLAITVGVLGGLLLVLVAAVIYLAADRSGAASQAQIEAERQLLAAQAEAAEARAEARIADAEARAAQAEARAEGDARAQAEARIADRQARDSRAVTRASAPASSHDRIVGEYLRRQSGNDIPYILDLYADRVRYYDQGWVSKAAIRADKARYFGRWPTRSNRLASAITSVVGRDGVTTLRFQYTFSVDAPSRRGRRGRAWAELDLESATGRIRGERGGVL